MKISSKQQTFSYMVRGLTADTHHRFCNHSPVLDYIALEQVGLVRPGPISEVYHCVCGGSGEVFWVERKDGRTQPMARCDQCGLTRMELDDIRTWDLVLPEMLKRIAQGMRISHFPEEVSQDYIWKFGRLRSRNLYFVAGAGYADHKTLDEVFQPLPTGLILVPDRSAVHIVRLFLPNFCIALEEIGTFDDEFQVQIDMSIIDSELELSSSTSKKPVPRRGNRTANIEKLVEELKEYYRASRDSYYGTGNLLPRLTQSTLARLTKLRQDDISRCLRDPEARELKCLWENMENEEVILNS